MSTDPRLTGEQSRRADTKLSGWGDCDHQMPLFPPQPDTSTDPARHGPVIRSGDDPPADPPPPGRV